MKASKLFSSFVIWIVVIVSASLAVPLGWAHPGDKENRRHKHDEEEAHTPNHFGRMFELKPSSVSIFSVARTDLLVFTELICYMS